MVTLSNQYVILRLIILKILNKALCSFHNPTDIRFTHAADGPLNHILTIRYKVYSREGQRHFSNIITLISHLSFSAVVIN